jgi:hypothetical protein
MAVTNTLTGTLSVSVSGSGKAISTKVGSYPAAQSVQEAVVVPAGATNQAITLACPFATIQLLVIASTQEVTVKMNSTTTPTETFDIKATAGIYWAHDMPTANPLGHDVVTIYVSNAGATDAAFDFWALHN